MAAPPSGNILFQLVATGVDTFPDPTPEDIGSGFDQCGAQLVVDNYSAGSIDAALQINMAPDDLADPQPAWEDVIDGGATGLTADGTTTLGPTTGDLQQVLQVGHGRRLRLLVSGSGGVAAGTRVTCYVSSIGSVGGAT